MQSVGEKRVLKQLDSIKLSKSILDKQTFRYSCDPHHTWSRSTGSLPTVSDTAVKHITVKLPTLTGLDLLLHRKKIDRASSLQGEAHARKDQAIYVTRHYGTRKLHLEAAVVQPVKGSRDRKSSFIHHS